MKTALFCLFFLVLVFCSCSEKDSTVSQELLTGSWITKLDLEDGQSAKRMLNLYPDGTWEDGTFIYTSEEDIFVLETGTWELTYKEEKPYIKFRTIRSNISFDPEEERFVEVNRMNRKKITFTFDSGSVELLTMASKRIKPIVKK